MDKITSIIANELQVKEHQVQSAIKLIDDGNTIPFIARYRKEATGGLSDETLRTLGDRLTYLRNLEKRKEEIKFYRGARKTNRRIKTSNRKGKYFSRIRRYI